MIALYIIGGIILLIAALLFLSVRIKIVYDDGFYLSAGALFVSIRIFPREKKINLKDYKLKKLRKKKKKKPEKKKEGEKPKEKKKKSVKFNISSLSELKELAGTVVYHAKKIIGKFGRYLKIRVDNFRISVAGKDAAAAAVTYGAVSQSASYLFTLLEGTGNLTYGEDSECDILVNYLTEKWSADISITFSIRIWQLVSIGISGMKAFFNVKGKIGS